MFKIVIREIKSAPSTVGVNTPPAAAISTDEEIYNQTVETLDIKKVIAAVNGLKEDSRGY